MASVLQKNNPLNAFRSYSTYFIIKIGTQFTSGNAVSGYEDATLILDSRGQGSNNSSGGNRSPELTVQSFDIDHLFNGTDAKVSIGLESNLVIYERGGAKYLNILGQHIANLGAKSVTDVILWVGVGVIGYNANDIVTPIPEKWFPTTIKTIDMSMRNSGSEYLHQLVGSNIHIGNEPIVEQTNIKETIGFTFRDHLDDLTRNVNNEFLAAKTANSNCGKFKTVTISIDTSIVALDHATVETNASSIGTGGIRHISSGGKQGTTTITKHIQTLIQHSPALLRDLTNNEQEYRITPNVDLVDADNIIISFKIIPYTINPSKNNKRPLLELNYFFGGLNEDVLEFEFNLDGAFQVIAQHIINANMDDIKAAPDRTIDQVTKVLDEVGNPTTPVAARAGSTTDTRLTTQTHEAACSDNLGVIPPKPKKYPLSSMNQNAADAWATYDNTVQAIIGKKLVNSTVKIRGNPLLILDDDGIVDINTRLNVNLDEFAAYITFEIGTPTPEFQSTNKTIGSSHDTFIYNGKYVIRGIKSSFTSDGKFSHELRLGYI